LMLKEREEEKGRPGEKRGWRKKTKRRSNARRDEHRVEKIGREGWYREGEKV